MEPLRHYLHVHGSSWLEVGICCTGETVALAPMETSSTADGAMRNELATQLVTPPPRYILVTTAGIFPLQEALAPASCCKI